MLRLLIFPSTDMLPLTLDILARTVYIPMHIDHTVEQKESMLKAILSAAASC